MIQNNKKYQLRCGWPVELYRTDALGGFPIHGAYLTPSGESRICQWTSEGSYLNEGIVRDFDLIEVKPRIVKEYWVNVYPEGSAGVHATKEAASVYKQRDCLACVKITIDCEEGEGL